MHLSLFWQEVIKILATGLLSGGFFSWLTSRMARKDQVKDKKEAKEDRVDDMMALLQELVAWKDGETELSRKQSEMLLGLAHDRIIYLGSKYLEQGYIDMQELDDFNTYLYEPYAVLGGNGTGEKIWERVNTLPVRNQK